MTLTIRLGNDQFAIHRVELDFQLGMLLLQGFQLLDSLIESLSQSNGNFGSVPTSQNAVKIIANTRDPPITDRLALPTADLIINEVIPATREDRTYKGITADWSWGTISGLFHHSDEGSYLLGGCAF